MKLISGLTYILDRKEKFLVVLILISMMAGAGFEALGIGLIMPFMSLIGKPDLIAEHELLNRIYVALGMTSYRQFVIWFGVLLIIIYIIKSLYLIYMSYLQYWFAYKKQVSLGEKLMKAYLGSPYVFHLFRNTSESLRNINFEVPRVCQSVIIPVLVLAVEIMVAGMITLLLVVIKPLIALIAISVLAFISYLFHFLIRKRISVYGEKQQYHGGQMIKWVNQGLGGIKETKVFGREQFFINAYTDESRQYANSLKFFHMGQRVPQFFVETVVICGILFIGIMMLVYGMDIYGMLPVLGLFIMSFVRLMPSVKRIISNVTTVRYCKPALDVICQDLKLLEKKKMKVTDDKIEGSKESSPFIFEDTIDLKEISYRYPDTEKDVIDNISISIPKNSTVAFVGPSGGGKTTLVDIILGLLDPTSGKVKVDGRDITENVHSWQMNIGYIPQSIYLLDDTIARNIAYSLPDDMINEDRVLSAVKDAQLEDFISSQPDGIYSVIGERGIRISGGQRQRIGIARAIYHRPQIIVMDEATSSLDNEVEKEIIKTIDHLSREKTIIIIAHRMSTVKMCDRLYFIKDGKVIDSGTYEELLNTNSEFNRIALSV